MECVDCGGALALDDTTGPSPRGYFTEYYTCVDCDGLGTVSGTLGEPDEEWVRSGVCARE